MNPSALDTKQKKHVIKFHTHRTFPIAVDGVVFTFRRDSSKLYQYVCSCDTCLSSCDSLKAHIHGVDVKSKQQPRCEHIHALATTVKAKRAPLHIDIQGNLPFNAWPGDITPDWASVDDDIDTLAGHQTTDITEALDGDQPTPNNDATDDTDTDEEWMHRSTTTVKDSGASCGIEYSHVLPLNAQRICSTLDCASRHTQTTSNINADYADVDTITGPSHAINALDDHQSTHDTDNGSEEADNEDSIQHIQRRLEQGIAIILQAQQDLQCLLKKRSNKPYVENYS